jgi:hypothetical protein
MFHIGRCYHIVCRHDVPFRRVDQVRVFRRRYNAEPLIVIHVADLCVSALAHIVLADWKLASRHVANITISSNEHDIGHHPVIVSDRIDELHCCDVPCCNVVHQREVKIRLRVLYHHRIIHVRNRVDRTDAVNLWVTQLVL